MLMFAVKITRTWLPPDMIIMSDSAKQLLILELTVTWEERMRPRRGSIPSTRSCWKGAGGKAGKRAVNLWRWAAGSHFHLGGKEKGYLRSATEVTEKATR